MTLSLEANEVEVEVKVLTSLASVTESTDCNAWVMIQPTKSLRA